MQPRPRVIVHLAGFSPERGNGGGAVGGEREKADSLIHLPPGLRRRDGRIMMEDTPGSAGTLPSQTGL